MKGIILKDLYENFRIFKNGVSYLAAVLFLFLLIEAMQTGDLFSLKYFFMLITAFVFPLLGCSSIESSLEQDEKVNFDKIQLTFPITKTEIKIYTWNLLSYNMQRILPDFCFLVHQQPQQNHFAGRAVCMGVRSSFLPCLFCSR